MREIVQTRIVLTLCLFKPCENIKPAAAAAAITSTAINSFCVAF